MKTNLVLGGSGTIGLALCNYLKGKGEDVINLDKKDGFDICHLNMDDYKNVDYVWFLAWEVGGAKYLASAKNSFNIIHNNTLLCQKIFPFLEKHKLPFMFASSQLASPNTPYGVTKLLGEEWTRLIGGQIVRFWNVFGWEEPGERAHVIPDLIMQALTKDMIELMTDGQEERQFIYMDDCVENMVAIRDAGLSRIDITNGKWVTIEKVAEIIGSRLKVPIKLGKVKGYSIKINPEFMVHKFNFKTSLEEGINKIVEKARVYLKTGSELRVPNSR